MQTDCKVSGTSPSGIVRVVSPDDQQHPYGYTPMDVAIEIILDVHGQIGDPYLITDKQNRLRLWLPDLPRTSGVAPIVGSDKLDYYHPTRKPPAYAAMLEALEQRCQEIPELRWIVDWMTSEHPLELEQAIAQKSKADITTLEGGRIVWRLKNGKYIHDLPTIQLAHAAQTLERAKGNGQGDLLGPLPRIHSKKLAAPLLGCNDDMFRSWGQHEKLGLNISAEMAVIATQRYTELLEAKGHFVWLGEGRYWVWGALPEMARATAETKAMAAFMGSDGNDLDPIGYLTDLLHSINQGAKSQGKLPEDLKFACGYIGIGGSGKGRAAIGQVTEQSAIEFLNHLLLYHQRQRRHLKMSKPFWVFGTLTVAEDSSKSAIAKANEQIFEAMINGRCPPPVITARVVDRLKIEGVPNTKMKKTNRQWAQIAYLAWLAPDFISDEKKMKPDTTLENLFAWHAGQVFAACKSLAYAYAHPLDKFKKGSNEDGDKLAEEVKPKETEYRNPIDAYRQILFSSPAQGLYQINAKVSPYLAARPDKAFWYHKTVDAMGKDCPNMSPPKRWNEEQAYFLALGMSEFEIARRTAKDTQSANGDEASEENS